MASSRHLVITVHGIRTFGHWQERLEHLVKNADPSIDVFNYKYGYFSVLAFLIPFLRWIVTRQFRKTLIHEISKAKWDRIDIVAHSFGTHLVGWALHSAKPAHRSQIHTIVLAGSVLKPGFPWHVLIGTSVQRVVNECGIHDGVLLLNQLVVLFTGMAGREGFSGMMSDAFRNRYFKFGHSGCFMKRSTPDDTFMQEEWLPLLLKDDAIRTYTDPRQAGIRRDISTIVLNNLEPIKLLIWMAPLLFIIWWVNEQRVEAISQRDKAVSQHLSAEARSHLDKQLDLALLLSIEAYKRAKTTEALQSLYTSIDSAGSSIFSYGRPDDGYGLTFSKDNKLLASGSEWGWLQLWDLNSTPPRSIRLTGHGERIYNLAVSPTHQTVVSNDEKGNVVLWDLSQTPPHPRPLQQHNKYVGTLFSYSSDGSLLASGDSYGTLLLYPFNSPIERFFDLQGHTNPIIRLMFTPDGKTLISGDSAGTFLFWDLSIMPPTQPRRLFVGEGDLQTRTLSPDGKLLATSDSKGHLWVWDFTVDQPQPTPLPGYEGAVSALAFGPNGKKLVAGDKKGTLLVWDLTVEPPRSIPLSTPTHNLFTHGVRKLAFGPNGTTIAASPDAGYGGFHLWDLKFNPPRSTFHGGHQDIVEKLIFSPDGRHLVTADNRGTHLMWHLHDESPMSRTIPGHRNGIVNVAFTTDGQSLGLVDSVGTCMIWKIDAPSSIQTHLHGPMQAGFEQINFSDDWTKLSAKQGRVPFLWDMTTNPPRPISVPKPSGGAETVRVSPDGTRLAVGGRDNITLSNLTSLPATSISLPSHGHNQYIWRLQFSFDSKFLASSDGRDVLLWNLKDPSFPKPFRADHKGRVGNFAFSPDNKHLASGGSNGTLLLWDLSTAPPQLTSLPGHATETDHYVNTVLFSPDGRYLVSGDSMTNLVLWDLKSREPRATPLPANRRRRLAAFNPKSDKLVIDKDYNSLSVYDLTGDLLSPISLSEHKDTVWDIAFSPNGTLISTELDGTVLTWDLESSPPHPAQLWTYQGPTRGSASGPDPFIFSSTGSALAVSVGNVLLLGDLTANPPGSIQLSSNEAFVKASAFSPDEKTLVGTYGKQVVLWNVDFDSWMAHACRIANRNLTQREWSHFLHDEPYRLTCKIYSQLSDNK